jgi:hypothetical protein
VKSWKGILCYCKTSKFLTKCDLAASEDQHFCTYFTSFLFLGVFLFSDYAWYSNSKLFLNPSLDLIFFVFLSLLSSIGVVLPSWFRDFWRLKFSLSVIGWNVDSILRRVFYITQSCLVLGSDMNREEYASLDIKKSQYKIICTILAIIPVFETTFAVLRRALNS